MTEIKRRAQALLPPVRALCTEKTNRTAASAQEKQNAVWGAIFALPVYRELRMDEVCNYHTFERLIADQEKWAQVLSPRLGGTCRLSGDAGGADRLCGKSA